MAKKRKNSNYVTEKNIQKMAQKEKERRAKKRAQIASTVIKVAVSLLLIAGIVVGVLALCGVFNTRFTVTHHASIEIEGYGVVHVELYGEEAPETVTNFVKLANEGFYDGLTFHRLIEGFMAQGGDPKGDGTGGSGTKIKGEFSANGVNNRIKHERGVISMARRGDDYNSATSQFFIVHKTSKNNTKALDGSYAAFGRVTEGMEYIDEILADFTPLDDNGTLPKNDRPVIKSITIHEAH